MLAPVTDYSTVLITGAGTATCQSVIKGLRAQTEFPARIVTVDMDPRNAGRYMSDDFETVPAAADDNFVPALLEICERHRVDLLIPIVDYEFAPLAKAREQFTSQGCTLALSPLESLNICNDKWLTCEFFRQLGIRTPRTWLPEEICPEQLRYPVFVKPRHMGRGSIDTHKVSTPDQLARLLSSIRSPLIQEFVEGREYTVDLLCDFAGQIVNGVVRERLETKAGVSCKGVTVRNDQLLSEAAAIAESLPIHGPANIQCFENERETVFFEINPRFSGALALTIAAGFNSPQWLLRLARRQSGNTFLGDYQEGICMLRYWQEVFTNGSGQPLGEYLEQAAEI